LKTVDVAKILAFSANYIVVLTSLYGIFSQDRNGLLIALDFGLLSGLLLILLILDRILEFKIDLIETGPVAALIVDQYISIGAFETNITGDVLLTAQDIHITLTGVEVVVILALKAGGLIAGGGLTGG
jgi:hypothetical protein